MLVESRRSLHDHLNVQVTATRAAQTRHAIAANDQRVAGLGARMDVQRHGLLDLARRGGHIGFESRQIEPGTQCG